MAYHFYEFIIKFESRLIESDENKAQ